jgi:hypothetical protein
MRAIVVRNGQEEEILARELVAGDSLNIIIVIITVLLLEVVGSGVGEVLLVGLEHLGLGRSRLPMSLLLSRVISLCVLSLSVTARRRRSSLVTLRSSEVALARYSL